MSIKLDDQWLKKREKIEYGVFGVIAVTISLSIQFSPKMGNGYMSVLFCSWILYFIAFTLSGLRIVLDLEFEILTERSKVYFKMKSYFEKRVEEIEKLPDFMGKNVFKEKESEQLERIENEFKKETRIRGFLNSFLFEMRFLHIIFYYFAVLLNILFAALNYYSQNQ